MNMKTSSHPFSQAAIAIMSMTFNGCKAYLTRRLVGSVHLDRFSRVPVQSTKYNDVQFLYNCKHCYY